jgi:MFS family permease
MMLAAIGGFVSLYATQAVAPTLREISGLGVAQVSALLTATTAGLACMSPLSPFVIRRFGNRRTMISGLALLTIVAFALAATLDYRVMLAIRFAQGATIPFVLAALLSAIEGHWKHDAAMRMSVSYVSGALVGGVIGRFLPGIAVPVAGWTVGMAAMGLLQGAILAVVAIRFPKDGHSEPRRIRPVAKIAAVGGLGPLTCAGAGFILLFTQTAAFTYIAFRFADQPFGWSVTSISFVFLISLPAIFLIGASRRMVAWRGHGAALVMTLGVSWSGLAMTLPTAPILILVGLALVSIATFVAQAILAHAVSLNVANIAPASAGTYLFSYYVGGSFGSLLPSAVWNATGWTGCVVLIATVQLLGGLALHRLERLRRRS